MKEKILLLLIAVVIFTAHLSVGADTVMYTGSSDLANHNMSFNAVEISECTSWLEDDSTIRVNESSCKVRAPEDVLSVTVSAIGDDCSSIDSAIMEYQDNVDNSHLFKEMVLSYNSYFGDCPQYCILNEGRYLIHTSAGPIEQYYMLIVGSGVFADSDAVADSFKNEEESVSAEGYSFETDEVFLENDEYYGWVSCYKDGILQWNFKTETQFQSDASHITEVALNGNTAYFATVGKLFAVNVSDGSVLWTVDDLLGAIQIIFDSSDNIYVRGYWEVPFVVVNKNGTVLDRKSYNGWVNNIEISGNVLYATCTDYESRASRILEYDISAYQSAPAKQSYTSVAVKENIPPTAEEVLSFYYKTQYVDEAYPEDDVEYAFYADLDGDRQPELLLIVKDWWSRNTIKVLKYKDGKVVVSDNIITSLYGTGIIGEFELLLRETGKIDILTVFTYADSMNEDEIGGTELDLYSWGLDEHEQQQLKYLSVRFNNNTYTTSREGEATVASDEKLDELIDSFGRREGDIVVFRSTETNAMAEDDVVWDLQKKLYDENGLKTSETGNYIVLQINNPNMSFCGTVLSIDSDRGTVPVIVDNRTLVPIRAIIESIGGSVEWDDATKTAVLRYLDIEISLTINQKFATINGARKELDVSADIINDRTMLPVRFITENLGCNVQWISELQQIIIKF